MQRLARLVRHLWQSPATVRRRFTTEVLDAVEAAVRRAEADHGGEVRFVIETDLSFCGDAQPETVPLRYFRLRASGIPSKTTASWSTCCGLIGPWKLSPTGALTAA